MSKLKVMTIIGTRPEIIRLSRVIDAFDKNFSHTLVHTGQNYDYELNEIFFDDLNIRKPDYFLNAASEKGLPSNTIGNIIIKIDEILENIKPEAILVLGDTNSCLSVIPAKRRKIPIFHMEAGNRCFDQRVPEEINRKIVDHVSDINLTYSDISREYLLNEGFPAKQIIKTGSPMYEVINHYKSRIDSSDILKRLNLRENLYFLMSLHREENIDNEKNFNKIIMILNQLASNYKLPVYMSTHPRLMSKIKKENKKLNKLVIFSKPFGFYDYLKLQISSKAVLSDSGTITEESSILNFPALNLRESHERPEGMEEASTMMTGLNFERIAQSLEILSIQKNNNENINLVKDYSNHNVSTKMVRIIQSYVDYVKQNVWKEI